MNKEFEHIDAKKALDGLIIKNTGKTMIHGEDHSADRAECINEAVKANKQMKGLLGK
jgi:hypothetical protein